MKRIGLFILAVVMVVGLLGCSSGSDEMSQDEWNSTIKMGMTETQVVAALGRQADRQFSNFSGGAIWYAWRFGDNEGAVTYGSQRTVIAKSWAQGMY